MYISRIYIRNFRNFKEFDLFIPNGDPLTVIGSNNTGKSNLIKAIRLVIDNKLPVWERQFAKEDFSWELGGSPWEKGEEIVITITISFIKKGEETNEFLHSLTPTFNQDGKNTLNANISYVFAPSVKNKKKYNIHEDYISFLVGGKYHPSGAERDNTGKLKSYNIDLCKIYGIKNINEFYRYFYLDPEDIEKLMNYDQENDGIEIRKYNQKYTSIIKKHINLLYLDALRDVKKDFFEGYYSVISQLIRDSIALENTSATEYFNEMSEALDKIRRSSTDLPKSKPLLDGIEEKLGSDSINLLSDKADLLIGTPNINIKNIGRYFNFLSNLIEESQDKVQLIELGLGYQNLIYITAIFALFELKKKINSPEINEDDEPNIFYNLLLTEEPEAHLDVQNQKYLHTQIENKTQQLIKIDESVEQKINTFTQVIQTSHSTHLTSKANLENIIVLEKNNGNTIGVNIDRSLYLENTNYFHDRRIVRQYLDATRSALLFARKVILVEGISEKFVLPAIIDLYLKRKHPDNKYTIDNIGIEVVEIGFKGFKSFYAMYSNKSLEKLSNKCLGFIDGDTHLDEPEDIYSISAIYKLKNNSNKIKEENIKEQKNVYTFEIDTFLLPDPDNPKLTNIEWLLTILQRFSEEDFYYQKENLNEKLKLISEFSNKIRSKKISKEENQKFFDDILYKEVVKPSIALCLASLIKAKHFEIKKEIESWANETTLENLPKFIVPKFIEDGLSWLLS